jgi:CO/xanthine dehydrogenase Mo-binding subunit
MPDTTELAPESYRYLTRSLPVSEDRRFVVGRGYYVADITPPGTLHVALVTSPYPHARITRIDTAAALQHPGVHYVLTGDELAAATEPLRQYLDVPGVDWRPLANGVTRYAGEWVVAVVADSRAIAEDGAELVEIDYEPLPFVIDPEIAASGDGPLVHPQQGSNVVVHREFNWGEVAASKARATGSSKIRVRWNRNSTVPLETFGVVASWHPQNEVVDVWASIQMPQFPDQLAAALRLSGNQVRVHFDVDVGGSFGVKRGIKHSVLASYLSMQLKRPVKFIEDRTENMHGGDFHGPDRIFDVELWYDDDGKFQHIAIEVLDDEGAYPGRSPLQLAKPIGAVVGPYTIPSASYHVTGVVTNKTGQVAVRGFGQSPTNYAIESAVDAVARATGIDRIELRRRNFIQPNQFPYMIPSGSEYDSGDYPAVVDKVLAAVDYEALVRRRDDIRASGMLAGIGIATCLEPGGGNAIFENIMNPKNDKTTFPEACRIRVDGMGAITAMIAISSSGQSHETMVATLVGEELGVDPAAVKVVRIDSLAGLPSQSPVGSRMAIVLGGAIHKAAERLKDKFCAIGAYALDVGRAMVEYADNGVRLIDDPTTGLSWQELVAIAHRKQHLMPPQMDPGLEVVAVAHTPKSGKLTGPDDLVQLYPCYSFEAHVVLATIDPNTGKADLHDYGVAHDCGTVINEQIVRGMLMGGIAHGIGVAFYEQFALSDEGQPLTQSLMDYLLPSSFEIPDVVDVGHTTPSPLTSFGQKGVGESGYMGAPAAVANAVNDALCAYGAQPVWSLPIKPGDIYFRIAATPAESRPQK